MDDAPVQVKTDMLEPEKANALLVALGRAGALSAGDPLPPFFHQLYFWDVHPPAALGRDGHPRVGQGLIPETGLPRRMWAGGQLQFIAPLRAGVTTQKRSSRESMTAKEGRSGRLVFVKLLHEFVQNGETCVREWQDLVYREDGVASLPPKAATDSEAAETRGFDSTLLFRYSALTFNGHRIHYDETYARDVEGYDGLVVHGPLLAQVMMLMAQETFGALEQFSFRGASPLLHHEQATFHRKGRSFWVSGPGGRLVMSGEA